MHRPVKVVITHLPKSKPSATELRGAFAPSRSLLNSLCERQYPCAEFGLFCWCPYRLWVSQPVSHPAPNTAMFVLSAKDWPRFRPKVASGDTSILSSSGSYPRSLKRPASFRMGKQPYEKTESGGLSIAVVLGCELSLSAVRIYGR